jgi:hypothetical protein
MLLRLLLNVILLVCFAGAGWGAGQTPRRQVEPSPPGGTPAAPTYRITVWVVRPLVKRPPSPQELEADSLRWMTIQGFAKPGIRCADDRKLLESLRRVNPLLSFPKIDQKTSAVVSSDTTWSAPLSGGISFKIEIKARRREAAIADLARTHGKTLADEFRRLTARQIVIHVDVRMPHRDEAASSPLQGSVYRGYRGVEPGVVQAVNPALSYEIIYPHANKPDAREQPVIRQKVGDIMLFCIEPMKEQGGKRT